LVYKITFFFLFFFSIIVNLLNEHYIKPPIKIEKEVTLVKVFVDMAHSIMITLQ